PGFSLSTRTEHTHLITTLRGELDIASAPALRDQLLDLLHPATSRLILDLSAVSYADASGVAVLVGTRRRAALLGGYLHLAAPPPGHPRPASRGPGVRQRQSRRFDPGGAIPPAHARPAAAHALPGSCRDRQPSSPLARPRSPVRAQLRRSNATEPPCSSTGNSAGQMSASSPCHRPRAGRHYRRAGPTIHGGRDRAGTI